MKSPQKVTKLKLNIERNNDFILLGLVSSEPDYKLSLLLNKKFGISLKNTAPIKFSLDDGSELVFSRFSNNDDSKDLMFSLISNRAGKNYLFNRLKNIDYLLQIQIIEKEVSIKNMTSALREIETVTAVFNVDINIIKDKNLHYLNQ